MAARFPTSGYRAEAMFAGISPSCAGAPAMGRPLRVCAPLRRSGKRKSFLRMGCLIKR